MMTTMSIHFCKYNGLPVVLLKAFIFQISNYLKRKGSYRNPEEINHAKAPFVPLNFHLKPPYNVSRISFPFKRKT